MPVLYLSEDDVRQVLTMEMALAAVEAGLRKVSLDEAVNIPRTRTQTDHAMLHVLSAGAKTLGFLGIKAYTTTKKGATFRVFLHDGRSGELVAVLMADYLGQVRTGAASGVATKLLARQDARTVGILGTGKQARTQLQAVAQVRPLTAIHAFSPNEARRAAFATEMTALLGVPVKAVESAEEAIRGKDIVITATTARDPIVKGEWLEPGCHINAIGSNFLGKAELDRWSVERADLIFVDSKAQALIEAGDFNEALKEGMLQWNQVMELGHLITGRVEGRTEPGQITLFKSLGVAIEDIAVAAQVYGKAKEMGLGRFLDI